MLRARRRRNTIVLIYMSRTKARTPVNNRRRDTAAFVPGWGQPTQAAIRCALLSLRRRGQTDRLSIARCTRYELGTCARIVRPYLPPYSPPTCPCVPRTVQIGPFGFPSTCDIEGSRSRFTTACERGRVDRYRSSPGRANRLLIIMYPAPHTHRHSSPQKMFTRAHSMYGSRECPIHVMSAIVVR